MWRRALRRTPDDVERRVLEMYQRGDLLRDIYRECGIVRSTLDNIRHRHSVPYRKRNHHGERSPVWAGGRRITKDGYVFVWVDPNGPWASMRNRAKGCLEHRLVMAQHLGRPLVKGETVHHINGDRQDNRIENLQLRSGNHGPGQVLTCNACGSHDVRKDDL